MNNYLSILFFLGILPFIKCTSTQTSSNGQTQLVKTSMQNDITYLQDKDGFVLPDFSYAGYKNGEKEIPTLPNKIKLNPIEGDNTAHIQAAIDVLASKPLEANGFRGAVYLSAGLYKIFGQIHIHASGIVLRGAGNGEFPSSNTILYGVGDSIAERELIVFGPLKEKNPKMLNFDKVQPAKSTYIKDNIVAVGSRSFEVADASFFELGQRIVIGHTCTKKWLEAVNYGDTEGNKAWQEGQHPIIYDRRIKKIVGNKITIDAPIFYTLNRQLATTHVYPYPPFRKVINHVGIENLRIDSSYEHPEDENHVHNSVIFRMCEDAWATKCVATHFVRAGFGVEFSRQVSILNCQALDPISKIEGARRYNFEFRQGAQLVLVQDCYARNGRHHFVGGRSTCSGNVVHRCVSDAAYGNSESHLHWATGLLFDSVKEINVRKADKVLLALCNRGSWGHSHGWSCAHCVAWNYDAAEGRIVVQQPPTAQNYCIGCRGNVTNKWTFEHPIGYIEENNASQLSPISLYEAQLNAR